MIDSPQVLIREMPLTQEAKVFVARARHALIHSFLAKDDRLVVVTGPCSIHDLRSAEEYALRLREAAGEFHQHLLLVMRVYLQKPRSALGWKGLVYDPDLDGSGDMAQGIRKGRALLVRLAEWGVPTAMELLDPLSAPYLVDGLACLSVGARTVESQPHRDLASSLPLLVGFKNNMEGNAEVAVDACQAASQGHSFLALSDEGRVCVRRSLGNPWTHVILRGSRSGPNYDPCYVSKVARLLSQRGLNPRLMVDCSHGNSGKDHRQQMLVVKNIARQVEEPHDGLFGVMLESHLVEGSQPLSPSLKHGQSVTDACIGWDQTMEALAILAESVRVRRERLSQTCEALMAVPS